MIIDLTHARNDRKAALGAIELLMAGRAAAVAELAEATQDGPAETTAARVDELILRNRVRDAIAQLARQHFPHRLAQLCASH